MELNLALSTARTTNSTHGRPRLRGFCGDVRLRETRCSYFLNLILQGLRTDEIEVEIDKERSLILHGISYCKEVGMLKWRWRLLDNGGPTRKRRPFKIPEDVNVGATRGSFERRILHLVFPKFTHSRFNPYHVIHIHSSHRHQQPQQRKEEAEQGGSCLTMEAEETMHSTTSSMSNVQEKKQVYRRTRRRRVEKITVKSRK